MLAAPEPAVADELLGRPPTLATGRLLAVDGPAGSGKTTLAHQVAAVVSDRGHRVAVLSLDDLYDGWTGLEPALEARVVRQVLEPLARRQPTRWQSYDWLAGEFGRWHELAPVDVLVLEGCGAGAWSYASYTTLLVWVEAAADVRLQRAVRRDGDQVLRHWAEWAAAEQRSFTASGARSRADVAVRT